MRFGPCRVRRLASALQALAVAVGSGGTVGPASKRDASAFSRECHGLRGLGGSISVSARGLCFLRVWCLGVSGESPKREPPEAVLLVMT